MHLQPWPDTHPLTESLHTLHTRELIGWRVKTAESGRPRAESVMFPGKESSLLSGGAFLSKVYNVVDSTAASLDTAGELCQLELVKTWIKS